MQPKFAVRPVLAALFLCSGFGMPFPREQGAAGEPSKVAAVTGTRGMARSVGGVIGASTVTLVLSRFPDQAHGMQQIYLGFGVLLLALVPLVFLIPDAARPSKDTAAGPQPP
jgi:hypothetical protein